LRTLVERGRLRRHRLEDCWLYCAKDRGPTTGATLGAAVSNSNPSTGPVLRLIVDPNRRTQGSSRLVLQLAR
jgi:hypothetical protein